MEANDAMNKFLLYLLFCKRQRQSKCSVVCFCVIALREQAFEDLPQNPRPINRAVVCQSATVGSLCKRGCDVVLLFYFLTMGNWDYVIYYSLVVLSSRTPIVSSSHCPTLF